jgi:death-on-curing protein
LTVEYLTVEDVLRLAEIALGRCPDVRDLGLLDSAVHRPMASAFGRDAYPDLITKAAALLDSLLRNHPFVDGNKRTAWVATATFCELNGLVLAPQEDDAYGLVMAVAGGELADIEELADRLRALAGKVA